MAGGEAVGPGRGGRQGAQGGAGVRAGLDGGESACGVASGGHGVPVVCVGGAEERPLRSASLGVADPISRAGGGGQRYFR